MHFATGGRTCEGIAPATPGAQPERAGGDALVWTAWCIPRDVPRGHPGRADGGRAPQGSVPGRLLCPRVNGSPSHGRGLGPYLIVGLLAVHSKQESAALCIAALCNASTETIEHRTEAAVQQDRTCRPCRIAVLAAAA